GVLDHHGPLPAQAHRAGRERIHQAAGALALRHQPAEAAPSMRSRTTLLLCAALLGAGCGHPFYPATPPGFVDMGERYPDGEYRPATAEGVVVGIRAFDNDPKGGLAFWSRALERRMRESGGYALLDKKDVTARGTTAGVAFHFGHDEGKTPYLYTV